VGRRGADVARGFMLDDAEREARMRGLDRLRARVRQELPGVEVSNDHWARRCDLAFDVGEARQVDAATRARLIDLIRDEGAHPTVSTVHAHAAPGTWDKATGAQRAARDLLDVDLAEARPRWLFVGDSGNDAPAFAWFAHTVGVANVRDHLDALPVAPRWVTQADRGRGFAEVAARVLHGR
jgi:hydroxymethylpyrimidine pyrophosphatase-like HAD family hydrolase